MCQGAGDCLHTLTDHHGLGGIQGVAFNPEQAGDRQRRRDSGPACIGKADTRCGFMCTPGQMANVTSITRCRWTLVTLVDLIKPSIRGVNTHDNDRSRASMPAEPCNYLRLAQ